MSVGDRQTSGTMRPAKASAQDGIPVLLAAGEFQPRGASFYTLRLAEGLRASGYRPILVCLDARRIPDRYRGLFQVLEYSLLDSPLLMPLMVRLVASDVRKFAPRLIHIQSRTALGFGQALARQLSLPCVATVHDIRSGAPAVDLQSVKTIIAVSESVRESLVSVGSSSAGHVAVIHSGVPVPDDFDNSSILSGERIPVVGTAGALESSKGLSFFLEAARKLVDRGKDVEFVIAGSGPEETHLRQQARDLKLAQRVTFVSNLLEFGASLRAMDIFCLPSLQQGLGTIMLEAMSLGRPVIASAVGGVGTILTDRVNGLVVQPSDSDVLADHICELLSNPELARCLGTHARQRVAEDFNSQQMVEKTIAVYESLQHTRGVSPEPAGTETA